MADPLTGAESGLAAITDMLSARTRATQPQDRITRILRKGSRLTPQQELEDLNTAFFAAFRANTPQAHMAGRPGKSIGEIMNGLKAQRIEQAEKQARIEIDGEQLEETRRSNAAREVMSVLQESRQRDRLLFDKRKHKQSLVRDNVKSVDAIMAPYKEAAKKGTMPLSQYNKAYQAVTDAVVRRGAIDLSEVQKVATETLGQLGLPELARVEQVGSEIVQVTTNEAGQIQVKPLYKASIKPSNSRFTPQGPYVNEAGNYIGEGHFDKATGDRYLITRDGNKIPMPSGARPITETGLLKNQMTAEQFGKWTKETFDAEASLRKLNEYWKGVKNSEEGWRILADQFVGQVKTVFGEKLTQEEFNTLVSTGRIQGLLGQFRLEVVGGGVMTEQDALRVIARLGGNVSALRNKEVVAELLKTLMQEKARRYNEILAPMFNMQLIGTRGQFYKKKDRVDVDESVFDVSKELTPEEEAELKALREGQK